MSEKELHDLLLKEKPEGAQHDEDKCPICLVREASQEEKVAEITQEQHEALLETAVEKAKTEVQSKVDAEILDLNEQLEQANETITLKDAKIEELEAQIKERAEKDRLAELAEERAELVRAAEVNFSDEQIEARKESWAAKSEEDFNALLEDYKAVAKAKVVGEGGETPPSDGLNGTRETAGDQTGAKAVKAFLGELSAAETV